MHDGPLTPSKFHRIRERCYEDLAGFRQARGEAFKAVVGRFYPGVADNTKRPVNLHQFLLTTLAPYLIPWEVSAAVAPSLTTLFFEGELLKNVLGTHLRRIRYAELVGDAAVDMIFSPMAVWRSGLMAGPNALSVEDREIPLGTPFTARVDLDDYFCDQQARDRREMKHEGERFRTPRRSAIESGMYGRLPGDTEFPGLVCTPDEARQVLENMRASHDRSGSEGGSDRASQINQPDDRDEVLVEMVEMCHVAFYDGDRTVVGVCPWTDGGVGNVDKWLSLETFEGDARGPYNVGSFFRLPNNTMPLALEAAQRDIADAIDEVAVKLIEDIRSAKTVNTYAGHAAEDAMAVQHAMNGEWIKVMDPASIGSVVSGGPQKESLVNFQALMSIWSGVTANLPLAAGLGEESADTATAFAGLMGRVNVRLEYLQRALLALSDQGVQHHAHYFCEYPVVKESVLYKIPGAGAVDWEYTSAMREGAYADYVFSIEPFTVQPMDPAVKSQRAIEALGVYAQFIPLIDSGRIRGDVLVRLLRQMTGVPEFEQLVNDQGSIMLNEAVHGQMLGPGGGAPPTPPAGRPRGGAGGAGGATGAMRGIGFQGSAGAGMGGRPRSGRPVDAARSALSGATPRR